MSYENSVYPGMLFHWTSLRNRSVLVMWTIYARTISQKLCFSVVRRFFQRASGLSISMRSTS